MATNKYSYFRVTDLKGQYGLVTRSEELADLKAEIDEANARAVARGYKAEQFLIIGVEVWTSYDENGEFIGRKEIESAIQKYPANLIAGAEITEG